MYKFAISGRAGSGKDTLSRAIVKELRKDNCNISPIYIAFADPIKQMILHMYPRVKKEHLFGDSKFRNEIIPGSFKNGKPLTIRQLLQDLGNDVGRGYDDKIWLNAFDHTLEIATKNESSVVIVSDVRYRNEFDHLKKNNFCLLRLIRNTDYVMNHLSETQQNDIKDEEFNFIIDNNGSLHDLKSKVEEIINKIKQ